MSFYYKALLILTFLLDSRPPFYAGKQPVRIFSAVKQDSVLQRETAIVDGTRYTAVNIIYDGLKPDVFCIKNKKGRIVYTAHEEQGILGFKFADFNGDGYKDIVVDLNVADSGVQDLVLYDPKSKKFVLAGDCSNAEKIKHTKYFYSYQDCCAGRNWSSDLFYISGTKIIRPGHIEYHDGEGLTFYKFDGQKKRLIKKWPVRINGDTPVTTGSHIDFDLGHYWTKHWRGFI